MSESVCDAGAFCEYVEKEIKQINKPTNRRTQSTHQLKLQSIGNGTTEKKIRIFLQKGATVTAANFFNGQKSYTKTLAN